MTATTAALTCTEHSTQPACCQHTSSEQHSAILL